MTILSPQTLLNVIDLIADGATVVEVADAIGASPKSKIIFKWLSDSAEAGEFGARPDASSPWCLSRGDRLEWFHVLFAEAKEHGRVVRAMSSPLRADLESRLAAKRAQSPLTVEPSIAEQQLPPRVIVEHVTQAPAMLDPPPPKARPSYAYRAPPLEVQNAEQGPPSEGRFSMTRDRPKSEAQRRAGTVSFDGVGVRQW